MHPAPVENCPRLLSFCAANGDSSQVIGHDGTTWTRTEFRASIDRLKGAFRELGLKRPDVIAILSPNCVEFLIAYMAGLEAGLFVAPINWHFSNEEVAYILKDSKAKAIVSHAALGQSRLASLRCADDTLQQFISIGKTEGFLEFWSLVNSHPPDPRQCKIRGRMLAYTSATSGRPKGVYLPPENADGSLNAQIQSYRDLGIKTEDNNVHLCQSTLYHSGPLRACEVAMHMGHCIVLMQKWTPEASLQLIEQHRVTTSFMTPVMFRRLLKLPASKRAKANLTSLRVVIHGGEPCPAAVKKEMISWWGAAIWEAYASTEVQGTIASAKEWLAYPGTVGRPRNGSKVRILDDSGGELPVGTPGNIFMTPYTGDRFEYLGDPEKTGNCYVGEFIRTGDIGYLNSEGYLFLCDRSEGLIISGGLNIYSAEIERAILEHPMIVDCAVVAHPHSLLGQVPAAYVEISADLSRHEYASTKLLEFLRAKLPAAKIPSRIELVKALPRDPSGKLLRRFLTSQLKT